MNLNKHIWEGWTIQMFIDDLSPLLEMIQKGNSWQHPIISKNTLKEWCISNQPYYKKYIPEVVDYFSKMYGIV